MELIKFKNRYDYGHEWYVQILNIKGWNLLQLSLSWNDYPSWPFIQIKSGTGSTLNLLLWVYKFGLDLGFIERSWSWEFLDDCKDETEFLKMDEC